MSFVLVPLIAAVEVGGYISITKSVFVLIALLIWARLLTFADKDAVDAHLNRTSINAGLTLGMIGAFSLFFFMPNFYLGYLLLLAAMGTEIGIYLNIRKKSVGLEDLKEDFKRWRQGKSKDKSGEVEAGKVAVLAKNGQPVPVPAAESPDRPGYDAVQVILTDPLTKNADRIELAPGEGTSQLRFVVDGVSYNGAAIERGAGTAGITYLKYFAGIDINEKRKPQAGNLKVSLDGKKKDLEVNTAGSSAGEFLKVLIDPKKRHLLKMDALGFSQAQFEAVTEAVDDHSGVVIVCAPKQQGLTSMLYALLRAHDAFVQHIQTIERAPDSDVEGVTQNKLAANAPAGEESKQAAWVSSQEPDVIMINQIEDPKTVTELIQFIANGEKPRRVYIGMRAANTFDALTQWRKLVGDDQLAMKHLRMIICGRVMRKLCMACKVAYTPEPEQLRKLNLNPASGTTLYQARTQPIRDPKGNPIPCEFCKELRYNGRFGVFELLDVNDEVRNVITGGGAVSQLKAAFRKQNGKLLQEMALAKVETGDTSVQEVLRVLKSDQPAAPGAPAGKPAAKPVARPPAAKPPATN